MSARKFVALALAVVLSLGVAAPVRAAGPSTEAEIIWLPDGLTAPTELAVAYVPEFQWLNLYRDQEGEAPCVYSLATGEVVEEFDYVGQFSEGLAAAGKDGKVGYIDAAGQVVIPMTWDSARSFHDGVAVAMLEERWTDGYEDYVYVEYYLIDAKGKVLKQLDEDSAQERMDLDVLSYPTPELQAVYQNEAWSFVDDKGQTVLTLAERYDYVDDFFGGLASVWRGDKCGLIDKTGQVVVPLAYDSIWDFSNDLTVAWRDGRAGLMDKTGREVVPCRYDYASEISSTGDQVGRYYYVQEGSRVGLVENPAWREPAKTAYASTQSVLVDGVAVEFQCYALKDENGNDTNYIKLRDLALILNGTAAQFDVSWDGSVVITAGAPYTPDGSEGKTPFSGDRAYTQAANPTKVNGQAADLAAFVLTDDAGGGYTYYKLRDLGRALGFNVDWSGDRGIFLETDKPYGGAG